MRMRHWEGCPGCGGAGFAHCNRCDGDGSYRRRTVFGPGKRVQCVDCSGQGKTLCPVDQGVSPAEADLAMLDYLASRRSAMPRPDPMPRPRKRRRRGLLG